MSEGESKVAVISSNTEIACLLVPLLDNTLILPTVSVAEMASMQPIGSLENSPPWLLGFYEWRNTKVPVISYEGISGGPVTPLNPQGRMAVLNNTGVNSELPFIAIPTQGIPRMVRVAEADISENTDRNARPYDDMQVKVGLEEFTLPDVTALEQACIDSGVVI
ncbi:chemotaxis protein CheW [Teredinibacter haidensis]|uniref:chemotaxis protein CheW n=1 Tax=Teredinibacter haidensis TaxID=2731755 RepID=UPI0009488BFA|nr:chemotaxis protein CheW [Teredinibacter haidensis]